MDYNEAGPQKNFEPIPDRTVVPVQLTVRPGEIGEGGWLTRSKDGASEGLDCEFIVTEGEYAKRKFWGRFTIGGATPKHSEAGEITRRMLRAILESARNIRPDDQSEAAKQARVAEYGDFDGLRFLVRVGISPAANGYPAKNTVREVITPDRKEWRAIEQIARDPAAKAAGTDAAIAAVISKPEWAK
jgi:hypothetical protein